MTSTSPVLNGSIHVRCAQDVITLLIRLVTAVSSVLLQGDAGSRLRNANKIKRKSSELGDLPQADSAGSLTAFERRGLSTVYASIDLPENEGPRRQFKDRQEWLRGYADDMGG